MDRKELIQKILATIKDSETNKWPESVLLMDLNKILDQEERDIKENCIDTIEAFRCEQNDYFIDELINCI